MVIPLRILSLCTGLGGLDLGIEIAAPNARVVCAVERDAYCAAVLAQGMEQGHIPGAPIWDDLRTFDGNPWRGAVDCVTAGYPCQPFSVAGQKRGAADPRHLWPEVARIVGECAASLVFLENVARHLTAGFDVVARDLHGMGYTVAALVCRAATVGAPHQRERLFALAVSDSGRERIRELAEWMQGGAAEREHTESSHMGKGVGHADGLEWDEGRGFGQSAGSGFDQSKQEMADSNSTGLQSEWWTQDKLTGQAQWDNIDRCDVPLWPPGPADTERWATVPVERWPSIKSPVRGMAHGLSDGLGFRREQLHALGNAVVPVQASNAFVALVRAHLA